MPLSPPVVSPERGRGLYGALPLVIIFFALIPPIYFYIPAPSADYWKMLMSLTGFSGMMILFIRIHWFAKFLSLFGLINCFLSSCPAESMECYFQLVLSLYLFKALERIDWNMMFKFLYALYFFNIVLLCAQYFGHDQLFNFNLKQSVNYGVTGQHMMTASFMTILTALIIQRAPATIVLMIPIAFVCHSVWMLLCAGVGIVVMLPKKMRWLASGVFLAMFLTYGAISGKFHENLFTESSRLHVWKRSLEMAAQHLLAGWGIGMFKVAFPAMSGIHSIPWKESHNDFVQFVFEGGFVFGLAVILMSAGLLWRLRGRQRLMAGLSLIFCDMMVHFPFRMIQSVPLIILFLAYLLHNIRQDRVPS